MIDERIQLDRQDEVGIIRLSAPDSLNALTISMLEGVVSAIDVHRQAGARALLLCGAGTAFCSGADLSEAEQSFTGDADAGAVLRSHISPMMSRLRDLPIPVVSAVQGAAAGVGCSIALAADIVLASPSAYFMQAFTRIGLIPDGGATYMLARSIGRARAMEMALLAEKIPAEKALEWGMINRIVPSEALEGEALAMAARLARGPSIALGLTRQAIWRALDQSWDGSLDQEAEFQSIAGRSEDVREGVGAFLARRQPNFQGR